MTEHENHQHGGAPGHAQGHGGGHASHSGHSAGGHAHTTDAELADTLELDALILGSYLEEASAWAAELMPEAPATIIDVGAGSGAGTLALARRFPEAQLTALDKSADMLERTLAAATEGGFGARTAGLQADLDGGWPASAAADLLWASSSLHELADPERTMAEMFAALNRGGVLLVVEMDALPSFLPDILAEDSAIEPGLEGRLHAVLAARGWNHHPDWTAGLEGAGFAVERRHFPSEGSTTPELAARYGRAFLGRMASALEGSASPADLASLALLLGDGPESLERRGGLVVRGHRTGWAARKL
ncbi:SAM-dependent methyltransferase [Arthrobacter stackebrandtii]|uniref:SAM-dependent methyltransferase n=1 Tax=Arthrobacter stackebrandtii TaxID=272161 RepID=A0ABS4Z0B7_9MICC|nr:class I SAM-dependent methyltransferase [Arthrobacter stackebrandtii]MBP2414491.1 SAM-dependent methyltransferase [Arthrobacter stackebrandtii]PYH01612.1 SAM-dependent methyltransferase [Arthrobacter stackebrandtii]